MDGTCQFAFNLDTEGSGESPDTGDDPPRDTIVSPDTEDPAPIDTGRHDTGEPDPVDAFEDVPPDTRDPKDTGVRRDTRPEDVRVDTGPAESLTCHEFALCQAFMCGPYDFQCKDKYSQRTSQDEIRELDARNRCMRQHCAGTEGRKRQKCATEHCEAEYQQCGREAGSGGSLTCSGFHACLQICNGVKNPQVCRIDCRNRASSSAQRNLQDYYQCYTDNCQDKEGRAALECTRNNCAAELSACWEC